MYFQRFGGDLDDDVVFIQVSGAQGAFFRVAEDRRGVGIGEQAADDELAVLRPVEDVEVDRVPLDGRVAPRLAIERGARGVVG